MGHSQAEKARNRERILTVAAAEVRRAGLESVSVVGLMKKVNLTHGGFYGHFRSRSNLLTEALKCALEDGAKGAGIAGERSERVWRFSGFVRDYLSRAHRDAREKGCAITALLSDVARADPQFRAVMSEYIDRYITTVTESLGEEDEDKAIVTISAMIGALGLSRVMLDSKRSNAMLKCVREYVIAMLTATPVSTENAIQGHGRRRRGLDLW